MKRRETDIVVSGAGLSGQITALVFAHQGYRVICVDAAAAPKDTTTLDQRSTAFLMPSIRLLTDTGIFEHLRELAEPLVTMRIVDAGGEEHAIRSNIDFDSQDAGQAQFGWNIPNAPMRQVLSERIEATPNLEMIYKDRVISKTDRTREAILALEGGDQLRAKLVIAADGRNSELRKDAGIDVTTFRYGQRALVFSVSHDMPHKGISTEVHRTGGPFTLVPLARHDQSRSAVVWMDSGATIDQLLKLSDPEFETALNLRSCGAMGYLKLTSDRAAWPIISQYASRLSASRLALVGEAAHVVPPIGAQGLNMSLADVATLRDLIGKAGEDRDIGSSRLMEAYHKARWFDMRARVQGVDALNRASIASTPILRDLRQSALEILGKTPSIKRTAIRAGLGVGA